MISILRNFKIKSHNLTLKCNFCKETKNNKIKLVSVSENDHKEKRKTKKVEVTELEIDNADKIVKVDEHGYPEEPTTCCMSGCANCVWLDYAEKLSAYYRDGGEAAVKEINNRVNDPNIKAFILHELRMRNKK